MYSPHELHFYPAGTPLDRPDFCNLLPDSCVRMTVGAIYGGKEKDNRPVFSRRPDGTVSCGGVATGK